MDYKGRFPEKIKLVNETIEVKNWRDLLVKSAEALLRISPENFNKLPFSEKFGGRFLSKEDFYLRKPYQLSNGYYLETHYGSNTIVRIVKEKLLKGCGFREADFKIFLRQDIGK